jgi:radical SAM protein with 4Fe4S-binding SPASM domain
MRTTIERLKHECLADPMQLYRTTPYQPRYVVWELTLRCNMRCHHCGSAAGAAREDELSLEEAIDLAHQLGALGCERLTLLGGEPLIYPHWEVVTKALQAVGVRVNIITNGWLTADEEMINRICDAGLTTLALSIDGYGKSHDELRRKEGSFARIEKTYDIVNSLGRPIAKAAVTTVTKPVMADLENIYAMLVDKGVRIWQLQVVSPLGRLGPNDPILCGPEDMLRLADFIVDKRREGKLRLDPADNVGYFGHWELEEGYRTSPKGGTTFWAGCQAGCQVAGIEANGNIKGCLSMPSSEPFIEGNVRERSLAEIWNDENAFAYNRKFTLEALGDYCAECEYRGLCRGGCISHCVSRTGHLHHNPDCLHKFLITTTR